MKIKQTLLKNFAPAQEMPVSSGSGFDANTFFEPVEALPSEVVELAHEYGEEKRSIKVAESSVEARKSALAKVEEKLYAMIEATGMTSFSTAEYTYYTRIDSYASVDAGNREAAFKWIRDEGYGDIVKLTANAQSLTSVVKQVFEATGGVPGEDDGIKLRTVNRVGVRRRN